MTGSLIFNQFIRSFKKHTLQIWISIVSLAIGLTCFILGSYWYSYETSFDNFHEDYKRINYIYIHSTNRNFDWDSAPEGLAKLLATYPEIECVTSFENCRGDLLLYSDKDTIKTSYYAIDSAFFKMFKHEFIEGSPIRQDVGTDMVVTESYARKMFGNTHIIGKTMHDVYRQQTFTICGVIRDFPLNSNLKFEVLFPSRNADSWNMRAFYTFIKVRPDVNAGIFMKKIRQGVSSSDDGDEHEEYRVVPINKMHLDFKIAANILSRGLDEIKMGLSRDVIQLFTVASILIIIASLINFIMLQTTLLLDKSKEVTLRYISGATFYQITGAFMRNMVLYALIAMCIAVCLTECLLPHLIHFVEITLVKERLIQLIISITICMLIVVALSAIYPSIRLKQKNMLEGLKGCGNYSGKSYSRNSMIFVQLIISCFILFSTLVIKEQMDYTKNKDLGIQAEQVYTLYLPWGFASDCKQVMNEIQKNPNIEFVTNYRTSNIFGHNLDRLPLPNGDFCTILEVNYDFLRLFGMEMKEGRFYSKELGDKGYNGDYLNMKGTSDVIILNEKAARMLNTENPVGYNLGQFGTVIGIMKNYHALSLREDILPMAFMLNWNREETYGISMKVKSGYEENLNSYLESVVKKMDPSATYIPPFSLKQKINSMYESETKVMLLLNIICVLSLFISAFGVYALALFTIIKRRKEVAIRKIAGATTGQIIRLFLKEYSLLIGGANIVALPFAFIATQYWLDGFAYHIPIQTGHFILTILIVSLIILLTVYGQISKIAETNPSVVTKE